MKKYLYALGLVLFSVVLVGCGKQGNEEGKTKEVVYLDKTYTVPAKTEKIVITGAMESMEDAKILDVQLTGAITSAGKFDDLFKDITKNAKSSGEKIQPAFEDILAMKPDVILASTKSPQEVITKLEKISTTIPVSHISTDWDKNLILLGQLSGKEDKANKIISDYNAQLEETKKANATKLKDKNVVILRYRGGSLQIYSPNTFANPILYQDLGLPVPPEVAKTKRQEAISLEQISQMNPDYIFVQYASTENDNNEKGLEDLKKNKIWTSLDAVKNGQAHFNIIDPLAQGGTAWSKTEFLDAFTKTIK